MYPWIVFQIQLLLPMLHLQDNNTVLLSLRGPRLDQGSSLTKVRILKRFEFTSQAMRSGAVAVPEDAPPDTALLLLKGAPSVIKHLAKHGRVPEEFDAVRSAVMLFVPFMHPSFS